MLTSRGAFLVVSCALAACALAAGLITAGPAEAQPRTLPLSYGKASIVTKVEGLPQTLEPGLGVQGSLRNAVCPPNRPYYKPSSYRRYARHRFRPFRDYYPFDPPFRCASWPWSTHVCVGQYVAAHPVPVGIDCVRR